jgi:hypothetical protein
VIATVNLSTDTGKQMPAGFLGVSQEWSSPYNMMGDSVRGVNVGYRNLLSNLITESGGPIGIRIGGNSTDSRPTISNRMLLPLQEYAQTMNVHYVLGIDLGSNDLSLAEQEMITLWNGLPSKSIDALEIGNESDLYGQNGNRPVSYSFNNYLIEYNNWTQGGASVVSPDVRFAGPADCCMTNFIQGAAAALTSSAFKPAVTTLHFYNGCYDPSQPKPPDFLLQKTLGTLPSYYIQTINAAHAQGGTFRLDEMNSLCGGGQPGVSDTFSSALWALDTMFEFAKVGVDGVNWHTGNGGAYALWDYSTTTSASGINTYQLTSVRPLYYGLLLFAKTAGHNTKMVPATTMTDSNIKVWVTKDETGGVHVLVINKDTTATGNVRISVPGALTADVIRLEAHDYTATTGISLGGQTFDGSTDGVLRGQAVPETATAVNGQFSIQMESTSAVLINLSQNGERFPTSPSGNASNGTGANRRNQNLVVSTMKLVRRLALVAWSCIRASILRPA